jgi:hypothetical protein
MTNLDGNLDMLTRTVLDERLDGYTFEEIAERNDMDVLDVVRCWKSYVDSRQIMSREDQWLLHLMRLERLLVKANRMLERSTDLKDFEAMIGILDRIEQLQNLNLSRIDKAKSDLQALTEAQADLIVSVLFAGFKAIQAEIESAFEKGRTIKAIRAEVTDVFDNKALPAAQTALLAASEAQEKEQQ